MSDKDPGPIPDRWLNCPRKASELMANKFLAFKTPLGHQFNNKVPEENRFTPSMLFMYMKSLKVKLGLWIDLTNTSRFYDKNEIKAMDCKYIKLKCRGHGETPDEEVTRTFNQIVSRFCSQSPLEMVGIHCTHGFNRTGFLLVCFMVEQHNWSVEAAISEFARIRPPGIYKQDYLNELYRRYDDVDFTVSAPMRPDWCNEEEKDYDDDDNGDGDGDETQGSSNEHSASSSRNNQKNRGRQEKTIVKTMFLPNIKGVDPFNTNPRLGDLQRKVQKMCGWTGKGFPGLQPVSMTVNDLNKLSNKPYRVSWKADGTRYMMLIEGENEVFMIDRDNCVFKVHRLRFLNEDLTRHLENTLLDGEMVVDKVNGDEIPRYLCYDIVSYNGHRVGLNNFYPDRLNYIRDKIVLPRTKAMAKGIINRQSETFSVRLKEFWDIRISKQLLGEKFAKSLLHEPDGLIFQPSKEQYTPGPCQDVLKWKPGHMNSVDFRLKIVEECGEGILRKKVGHLCVDRTSILFAKIKATKELRELDNKIIECKLENNQWVFMRERTDKSFPNSYKTTKAVVASMQDPVTKERLIDYIDKYGYHDDADLMPPPKIARKQ